MIYATFWAEFKHQFFEASFKKHTNHNPASQQNNKPTNHKPQPHKPTNHFPKTLARRNARKRLNNPFQCLVFLSPPRNPLGTTHNLFGFRFSDKSILVPGRHLSANSLNMTIYVFKIGSAGDAKR